MTTLAQYSKTVFLTTFILVSSIVQANPVACFNTNLGDFCMELYERHAPQTVANFLNYVNNDTYLQSIFHRSEPGFVVQGGGFKVVSGDSVAQVSSVTTFDPVTNEFGLSNIRSTVAMAKLGGDPNSATSQWFVNLADNTGPPAFLDTQNGGFTVFAKILYDGMTLFDTIAGLQRVNFISLLGGAFSSTPTVNYDVTELPQVENFVVINDVDIREVTAVFENGALTFAVDIGNNDFFEVRLELVAATPNIVFELDTTNVTPLTDEPTQFAVFSGQEGTLLIPSVMISETTQVNNVLMSLSARAQIQFTLISFE